MHVRVRERRAPWILPLCFGRDSSFFSHVSVRTMQSSNDPTRLQVLRFVRLQAHDIVERLLPPSQRGCWELFSMYGVEGVFASS